MHPVLFQLGPVTIYAYGVMLALGFAAAIIVARIMAPEIGVDPERFTDLGIVAIVGGLVGSYVNFVISYDWSRFAANPASLIMFWDDGGLVFLGGLIGGIIFAVAFIHKFKLPLWEVADITAICVPLAYGMGRIGCFFAGCCYGVPSVVAWAVRFPGHFVDRHPTQIYSVLLGLGLAAFAFLFRNKRTFAGQSFLFYLMFYGIGRGLIEILREEPFAFRTSLSVAQFTGLLLVVISAVLYPFLRRRNSYPTE